MPIDIPGPNVFLWQITYVGVVEKYLLQHITFCVICVPMANCICDCYDKKMGKYSQHNKPQRVSGPLLKVIHKEYSRFLNQFFPTPCLYHELNLIIHTSYINI